MFSKWLAKREPEVAAGARADARYGDELLSANWNPVIDLLARSCSVTRERVTHPSHDEGAVDIVDIEGFLNRVYTLGA